MLIKFDHRVSWALEQDADDVIKQLERSGKIYQWVKGEDVRDTVERWALANPRGQFAQMSDWTKSTYMARLSREKDGTVFNSYKLESYDPTSMRAQGSVETVDREQPKGVQEVQDYIPAKLKRPEARQDLKKVSEADADDGLSFGENPSAPPADLRDLPPTVQDDAKTNPGMPVVDTTKKVDPLDKFRKV